MSDLKAQLESLKQLNRSRFDYVIARAQSRSITDALERIGFSSPWYYRFSEEERAKLEGLAMELHAYQTLKAFYILEQAVADAAEIKVSGLKDRDSKIKQASATEILDRAMGKPLQKSEITGDDGGAINIIITQRTDGHKD